MKRSLIGGTSAGTALLLLLLFRSFAGPSGGGQNTGRESSGAGSNAPRAEMPLGLVENGPWRASRTHFAGSWPHGECPTGSGKSIGSGTSKDKPGARETVWCIPQHEEVRVMLAIVPDPVHTHMALQFDRSIEALQLAASSVGYVIDRYWLPWRPDNAGEKPSSSGAESTAQAESLPGLLLFRRNGPYRPGGPNVLFVFVVSDTSTAGINGIQFRKAAEYFSSVCGPNFAGCGGRQDITVMGPTFSGSLFSLKRLAAQVPQNISAYSGTVSSRQAMTDQGLDPLNQPCRQRPCRIEFHSLVHDTDSAIREFLNALKNNGSINCSGTEEVAVLSEAATTYGAVTRQGTRQCYANFVYPREISTLRNAYKNVPQPQQPGATAGSQPGYLPFTLNDRQPNDSDEPPDFAFQQGPLSKEAVLMDFANDLRRRHFRYIGINGTNVLDVLFLANFLRSSCPDSRLFILNSDLLFERSQDNAPYIGMLSVTTYPLIGRNVHWTGGEGLPRQPFADQYEQGQYNAALRAMQTTLPVENGGGTQAGSRFYEIAPPFDRPADGSFPDRLPVWMTVVGTGGYWPVQVLFPAGNEAASGSPKMTSLDFSPAWATITGVLIALCLAQCLVLLRPSPFASRLRDFAVTGVACSQRLFFINVASACLALCVAMLLTPACRFGPGEGYMWWLFAAGAAAVGCLFATCFRLEFQCRAMLRNCAGERNDHQFLHTLAHAGVWTVAVLGEWLWIALMWDQPGHYSFFFAYRAVHLASGVSPFTPALPLLASVYLWCVFEIWRLRFADQVRPRLLAAGSVDSAVPGAKTEQAIARSVNRFWLRPSYAVSCAILFGIWLFFLHPTDPFEVFEHRAFVWLYEIMLWVAVGLMVSSGFRLGQTWSDLRGLLRELERSPIRLAFARVTESSWSPIWESGDQEDEFIAMARSFELLTVIKSGGALIDDQLKEQVAEAEALRRGLRADWEHYSAGIPGKEKTATAQKLREQFGVLQDKLAAIMNGMFSKLQAYWASHGAHAADEKDDSARQARGMEEYVALRYVAFIRGALGHVKHLLIFTAACFSLVLIALNIYSFEPHQSLIWSFTVIFAAVGVTVIGVLMEAHRDHILSRITGTKPNELGWQFYVRVAGFGAAPLLALLATHFPAIGRYLMSLFQPGMEALK